MLMPRLAARLGGVTTFSFLTRPTTAQRLICLVVVVPCCMLSRLRRVITALLAPAEGIPQELPWCPPLSVDGRDQRAGWQLEQIDPGSLAPMSGREGRACNRSNRHGRCPGYGVLDRLVGNSAEEIASAFISLWRTVLSRSDFGAGCSVAAVAVAAESSELRDRTGGVFRTWRWRLAQLLEEGGVTAGRGAALAASLISACEGAVILSRAERSMEPFNLATGEQLERIRAETVARKPVRGRSAKPES